uniref:Uncharacterized protein n=1 Tax=Vitis vinifera TaxID=29760 RepID=F6H5B5_VITVI
MATALHSVVLPCSSSSDPRAALLPGVMPSPTVVSVGRSSFSLPEFSGLKIHTNSSSALASLNSRTSRVCRRGGRIVCEAQETALDGEEVGKQDKGRPHSILSKKHLYLT